MSNVQPMFEPDAAQMRRHVGHLFEGWLDGCHEGRIELAWTDARDGRLRHALSFGTDELDELVERAVQENRVQGQNVYIGQALRQPSSAPFERGKDEDFFALTAYYVDIDDDVTATASINYRNRGCPPTGVVVTGRHPHVRAQMLWRLESPVRDAAACREQNIALAYALNGDLSVVNPSRVLRLGGSIAWPTKEGPVIERTEFLDFDDGRPKTYYPEQIARAFPPVQASLPANAGEVTASDRKGRAMLPRHRHVLRRRLHRCNPRRRSLARQHAAPRGTLDCPRLVRRRDPGRRGGDDAAGLYGRRHASRRGPNDRWRTHQMAGPEPRASDSTRQPKTRPSSLASSTTLTLPSCRGAVGSLGVPFCGGTSVCLSPLPVSESRRMASPARSPSPPGATSPASRCTSRSRPGSTTSRTTSMSSSAGWVPSCSTRQCHSRRSRGRIALNCRRRSAAAVRKGGSPRSGHPPARC